ncbi:zf-HC2 domain-containing protein [Alkalibacter mobilis]|uniref:zf-HC2 domain-containing protein n=1 Tax=Alkalibacter mobilis TaxID=2787712 RepID=UPI0018A0EAC2|nr:zf-HC2 domain-containing protein [Alkalibacter mobilis]MBF7097874.1 zf-HC2 domain-containing protein [Alkalibacter mobilis]
MKNELNCNIVQDLLPNYIEKLTSDDTNHAVEQHLDTCEDCYKVYEQMAANIGNTEKVPVIELKFLKKVKRTRLLAAMLCVILTLVLSWVIYTSEYNFANDKSHLAAGITEFIAPSEPSVNAYVLETKEVDGLLFATFKDQERTNINGIAILDKGFNQRYRILSARIRSSDYSSVLQILPITINNEPYYAISGYNLSDEIKYYGLDFYAYTKPGDLAKDRVRKVIKFDVENQQFLEIISAKEIEINFENSIADTFYNPRLDTTSMYDADGKEITDNFKNQENSGNQVRTNLEKAELFLLYVFIAIVMGLGVIFTRYFLTE